MTTRREFIQSRPAMGTVFAVANHALLDEVATAAPAQAATAAGHFALETHAPEIAARMRAFLDRVP